MGTQTMRLDRMWMALIVAGSLLASPVVCELDPESGRFYFRDNNPFPDDTLGRIALYPINQKVLLIR